MHRGQTIDETGAGIPELGIDGERILLARRGNARVMSTGRAAAT
jgi:hypothetical protein